MSFMISSVLIPAVPRPRIRATTFWPRDLLLRAFRILTAFPEIALFVPDLLLSR